YITSITDKKGLSTGLAWTFSLNAGSQYEATKIELTNAGGLKTTYDRSVSSSVATVTNGDGFTQLSKLVNTPVTGDPSRTSTLDFYTSAFAFERWSYAYSASGDLTQ